VKIYPHLEQKCLLALLLAICLHGCGAEGQPSPTPQNASSRQVCAYGKALPNTEIVSFASLSANSEHYHGRRVRSAGFLVLEFERTALYESEQAFRNNPLPNIWVSMKLTRPLVDGCDRHPVLLEGVYDKNERAYGFSAGGFRDVTMIRAD
jgi:hypothetical protein